MVIVAAAFIVLSGVFFIVKRREVTWVHTSALGGRMPQGCVVAEGVALIAFGIALALAWRLGWW